MSRTHPPPPHTVSLRTRPITPSLFINVLPLCRGILERRLGLPFASETNKINQRARQLAGTATASKPSWTACPIQRSEASESGSHVMGDELVRDLETGVTPSGLTFYICKMQRLNQLQRPQV